MPSDLDTNFSKGTVSELFGTKELPFSIAYERQITLAVHLQEWIMNTMVRLQHK